MPVVEKRVYTPSELAEILGMPKNALLRAINEGTFPLPVMRFSRYFFIPKAAVDKFLKGRQYIDNDPPTLQEMNRFYKNPPGKTKHLGFQVTRELHEQFNRVCTNINMNLEKPLNKSDFLRIAVQEFVDRRPQYEGGEVG